MTTIVLPRAVVPHGRFLPANWAASLLFAAFVAFLPWEAVRGDAFADLANYSARMHQLQDHGVQYFHWEDSLLGWLRFEYFWFRLLALAAYLNIEPLVFMKGVTLAASFLTHRFLAARVGPVVAFLVLANPISIDLLSSQTRSAFAFALFLTVADWLVAKRHAPLRLAALAALPFIHSATIAVIAVHAAARFVAFRTALAPLAKAALTLAGAAMFVVAMVFVLPELSGAVGDRRNLAAYESKTLMYLSFWFLAAGALAISYGPEACGRWEYLFALFVCTSAPVVEALGRPGFRFVALAVPLIWIGLGFTRGIVRRAAFLGSAGYLVLLYYYWVR